MVGILRGRLVASGSLADLTGPALFGGLDLGALDGLSPIQAFLALRRSGGSGLVGLRSERETLVFRMAGGKVLTAASDVETDDAALLRRLLRERVLRRNVLEEVTQECDQSEEDLGRALFERDLLAPLDLLHHVREITEQRLHRALGFTAAEILFAGTDLVGPMPPAGASSIDLTPALAHFMRKALLAFYSNDIEVVLGPFMGSWLQISPEQHAEIDRLGLPQREQHPLAHLFDGAYQVPDILDLAITSRNQTARLIVLLLELGLCGRLDRPAATASRVTEAQRLTRFLAKMDSMDHFSRLESHWAAHGDDLERAWLRVQGRYGPGGELQSPGGPEADLAKRIFEHMRESWARLADRDARRRYRNELIEPLQRETSADLFFAQARTAELQGDFALARKCYQTALELHADRRTIAGLERLMAARAGRPPNPAGPLSRNEAPA